MSQISDFMHQNYISILIVIVIISSLMLLISIKGWDLNPPPPDSKLVQEITVETLVNQNPNTLDNIITSSTNSTTNSDLSLSSLPDSFCKSYLGQSYQLESACGRLTQENCNETSCCVFTSDGKCRAGSKNGPTFQKDANGNMITMDYYYYLGTKVVK
jgi:hypothetical protein